jgi:hypothetical protein
MAVAKRHPRRRHAAKGIEPGTQRKHPAPNDYQATKNKSETKNKEPRITYPLTHTQ